MVLEEGEAVTPIESYFYVPWLSGFAERGGVRERRHHIMPLRRVYCLYGGVSASN